MYVTRLQGLPVVLAAPDDHFVTRPDGRMVKPRGWCTHLREWQPPVLRGTVSTAVREWHTGVLVIIAMPVRSDTIPAPDDHFTTGKNGGVILTRWWCVGSLNLRETSSSHWRGRNQEKCDRQTSGQGKVDAIYHATALWRGLYPCGPDCAENSVQMA